MSKHHRDGWYAGEIVAFIVGTTILGIVLLPILVAIEIKAWLARHRIRKEQMAAS